MKRAISSLSTTGSSSAEEPIRPVAKALSGASSPPLEAVTRAAGAAKKCGAGALFAPYHQRWAAGRALLQRDAVVAVAGDVRQQTLVTQSEQMLPKRFVELPAESGSDLCESRADRHARAIGPRAGHRIESIADAHDPGRQRKVRKTAGAAKQFVTGEQRLVAGGDPGPA
ncbi:MAG: hypothetical protein K0B16_15585 [Burkholderiaceae bacterium]|nr:hypothetical protein [Burkholderiaceae bacterium]